MNTFLILFIIFTVILIVISALVSQRQKNMGAWAIAPILVTVLATATGIWALELTSQAVGDWFQLAWDKVVAWHLVNWWVYMLAVRLLRRTPRKPLGLAVQALAPGSHRGRGCGSPLPRVAGGLRFFSLFKP